MIDEVKADRISVVIVKDMSRFGRDYLQVGTYMEVLRKHDTRLIALNDSVDTLKGDDEFTPFRNIMNEWYARDTSKKIRSAFQAKNLAGKHTSSSVPYGYLKSEQDKNQWVVDPVAAPIVQRKISTLEQLHTVLSGVKQKASQAGAGMRKAEKRMKDIAGIQSAVAVCQEQNPIHDKYLKIGWKKRQAAFAEEHQEELRAYNKAYRYLKAQHVDLNVNLDALEAEYSKLQADHAAFARKLEQVQADLKPLNEVRYWVGQVLGPEQVEVLAKAEGKQSVVEQLRQAGEQNQKQDKAPQKEQEQKMEL